MHERWKGAKLLFLDEVPPVYVPSSEVRSWRGFIEHRHKLVRERTRTKNSIRALLRGQGIQARTNPKMAARMDIETSRIWSGNDRWSILVGSQERKLGGADEVFRRHKCPCSRVARVPSSCL